MGQGPFLFDFVTFMEGKCGFLFDSITTKLNWVMHLTYNVFKMNR